jgi:cyclopropane fatty-acyl-phospholipid synthase-like methyltransferase
MGEWMAFWDSKRSIHVSARHRDLHYYTVACDIRAHLRPGARVLDYGCGEALHADHIAARARQLTLCEAAPGIRAEVARRFAGTSIEVRSPEEIAALAPDSFDVIVLHSVAQYLTPQELDALLATFYRLLGTNGLLVLGDIIPPHVSAATDAAALLRLAASNDFFGAAVVGLVRTLASDYWRLRSRIGLTRYDELTIFEKLARAGFYTERAAANIGHDASRMTFLARRY